MNSPPLFPAGTPDTPVILSLAQPLNNAVNVPLSAPIRIAAYPDSLALILTIYVNGENIYNNVSYQAGYYGFVKVFGGRKFYEFAPRNGFEPGKLYTVRVVAYDGDVTEAIWSFTAIPTASYAGNALLPLERALLTPLTRFLELEPVRQMLLQQVLIDTNSNVTNRDNVAARALYQLAYESEISAALNPFAALNKAALDSIIPSKRPTLALATLVESFSGRIELGLTQLFNAGVFPREFRNNFADYLESLLYSYRVSAAATLVFLACAIEAADNG
jgi:hypothetical protein